MGVVVGGEADILRSGEAGVGRSYWVCDDSLLMAFLVLFSQVHSQQMARWHSRVFFFESEMKKSNISMIKKPLR